MPIVNCDYCGDEFEQESYKIERNDNQFCSRDCYHGWRREDWQPDGWKGGKVAVECEWCGSDFEVYPYRADSARFCSRECSDASKTANTEADSPRWKGGKPEHTCQNCGETFKRYDSVGRDCDYCSKTCYREASKELFAGENNPVWRGGTEWYYGPNWEDQRLATIKRDAGRCQDCGKPASEMPRSPDVHHKTRLGWYKEEYDEPAWWENANVLSNLVTLCPPCHKKREWESSD